jgi:hypothetical protein
LKVEGGTVDDAARERLVRKWRERDARAKVRAADLRDGRPGPPPQPLGCERCQGVVGADDVNCFYGGYWLCRACAKVHRNLALWALARFGPAPSSAVE